jgi:hypothetical protein
MISLLGNSTGGGWISSWHCAVISLASSATNPSGLYGICRLSRSGTSGGGAIELATGIPSLIPTTTTLSNSGVIVAGWLLAGRGVVSVLFRGEICDHVSWAA